MINLLHAELFKLKKSVALKICFLITTLCGIILAIVSHGAATGELNIAANSASGLSDIFILSVIGSLMAGIIICNDFESKDIHDAISCGRFSIVLSKTITFVLVVCVLALPYAIVGFSGFLSGSEFSDTFTFSSYTMLMANIGRYEINSEVIFRAIGILVVSIILYAGRLSICIPIAFKVRKPVIVAVIGVVFSFAIDFVVSIISDVKVLGDLIDYTPYPHLLLSLDQGNDYLLKVLVVSVVWIIIMIIVTHVMFKRSEIK